MNNSKILIIGHEGASTIAPGNTLKAFRKAIELKADLIEFDLQFSKDNEMVIHHDSNILNTSGYDGLIREMTLKELKLAGSILDKLNSYREFLEKHGKYPKM